MSEVCCNKEHILKYHMILWQRWDHGSSSVANYQILNCAFEHFINYCDFIWLSQINFVLCKSSFMKSLLSAAYHQCNILSNHFTYSPSTSSPSPSPSMTITIYHQHHYHHYYHNGLCYHTLHPAVNHPLLHAMCPQFVSLCVIVPAEAVWQPDQLHFDDARACLALQLRLMESTSKGEQWGLWPLQALAYTILHIPPLV